jgi:hypothetical protein
MTISWHSISISLTTGGSVIFNGYFNVDDTTNVIQNFYYVNNNQYVDILLRDLGDNSSDNQFIDNNFTDGGTNILSVIPYINTLYNNPYKLNLWYASEYDLYRIDYNPTDAYDVDWVSPGQNLSTFNFTSISGLPPLSIQRPFFSMRSLFTNNAQVYYKPHSLSTGSGGSGVRNYRKKQHRT